VCVCVLAGGGRLGAREGVRGGLVVLALLGSGQWLTDYGIACINSDGA